MTTNGNKWQQTVSDKVGIGCETIAPNHKKQSRGNSSSNRKQPQNKVQETVQETAHDKEQESVQNGQSAKIFVAIDKKNGRVGN